MLCANDKHTCNLYLMDVEYIDEMMWRFPIGSVAQAMSQLVRAHKYCIKNSINFNNGANAIIITGTYACEVELKDFQYIDMVRQTPMGVFSICQEISQLVKAHKHCIENSIDFNDDECYMEDGEKVYKRSIISKSAVVKIAKKNGADYVGKDAANKLVEQTEKFVANVTKKAIIAASHANRRSIRSEDIDFVMRNF